MSIRIPRGNNLTLKINLKLTDGSEYVLGENDSVIFTVKQQTSRSTAAALRKKLTSADYDSSGALIMELVPADTADMSEDQRYYYDIAVQMNGEEFYTAAVAQEFRVLPALSELKDR